MYIYKTTNLLNGKFYIGKRVYRAKDDDWYLGSGIYLNRAIKKYGRINFKKEIIEWCNDKNHLCEREKFWIIEFKARELGYNLSEGVEGGNVGVDAYNKISKKSKSVKKPKEFGEKISKALKGKSKSKDHIEKVRLALIGKKRSLETITQMSKTTKAKYASGWQSPVQITVYQYDKKTGDFLNTYKSSTEASKLLNISRKGITNNCNKIIKSSGGFIWSKEKFLNIKNESRISK